MCSFRTRTMPMENKINGTGRVPSFKLENMINTSSTSMEPGELPYLIRDSFASSPKDMIQSTLLRSLYLLLKTPCQSTTKKSLRLSQMKLILKQTDQAENDGDATWKPQLKPNPSHPKVNMIKTEIPVYKSYL